MGFNKNKINYDREEKCTLSLQPNTLLTIYNKLQKSGAFATLVAAPNTHDLTLTLTLTLIIATGVNDKFRIAITEII